MRKQHHITPHKEEESQSEQQQHYRTFRQLLLVYIIAYTTLHYSAITAFMATINGMDAKSARIKFYYYYLSFLSKLLLLY
jgi:hypothetical protein